MGLKKILILEDFIVIKPTPYVEFKEIEKVLGKRRYKKFVDWMFGQTCSGGGVYPWDLELYIEQINKGVKKPFSFD